MRRRPTAWIISPTELFLKEYVSYSRLSIFDKCPRQFELVYLCGQPDVSGQAGERGQLVHKMIELHERSRVRAGDTAATLRSEDILSLDAPAEEELKLSHTFAEEQLRRFVLSYCALDSGIPFEWVSEVERRVKSRCRDYDLECVVDRIVESAG